MCALFRFARCLAIFAVLEGCQRNESAVASMMHQVLGALQIPDEDERNSELASVCLQCAIVGDTESILLGIPRIEDETRRDEVGEECVTMLVSSGKKETAMKVIQLISDPSKRNRLTATLTSE